MKQDNNDKSLRIADLIAKFMKGELSAEESGELEAWLDVDPKNKELFAEMNDPSLQKKDFEYFANKDIKGDWGKISFTLEQKNAAKTRSYKWWAIAATVLFALSLSGWWLMENKKSNDEKNELAKMAGRNIYPGSYTATLIDGNGISHHLFQNSKDTIGSYATNTSGGLTYLSKNGIKDSNTLIVPIKGIFQITLEDGTEVWLHPSSTLKYPVCFTGKERKVILTGEAYFKVAKNSAMPFRVYCKGVITEAVGTEFNVNGYNEGVTTSLVEGIVHVITNKGTATMTAGNSLHTTVETAPEKEERIDTSFVQSWKNGNFNFKQTKLTDVMKALAGWYGIDVSFSDKFNWNAKTFNGNIPRNIPLDEVLQILSMTDIANFKVQNNTIYIYPYKESEN